MPFLRPRPSLPTRAQAAALALRAATILTVALPLPLLHARAVAEIFIAAICLLFLFHCWATADWPKPGWPTPGLTTPGWSTPGLTTPGWGWLRSPFALAAAAWWLWQIVCSVAGTGGLTLALVAFRFPLLALALGGGVLASARSRRWLWWALALSVLWIVLETWQQYLFGTNLFGQARWGDGALTGPFNRPRAGPALILILFAVLVPGAARLLAGARLSAKAAGAACIVIPVASVLLIGQRMPSALLVLGLACTGLLLPRLRLPVTLAALLGAALLAATPYAAPDTYQKLIVHTHDQLANFVYSPYGELWVRATVIAQQHPWLGLGFDGFRRGCADPHAIQGLPLLGVTLAEARIATDACNIHPHNYYLEAADNGGVPLLLLFIAMVGTALARLCAGLRANPMRIGLLVSFVLAFWPVASTSAFTSMPNAGWIFLLVGFGFAEKEAVLF